MSMNECEVLAKLFWTKKHSYTVYIAIKKTIYIYIYTS